MSVIERNRVISLVKFKLRVAIIFSCVVSFLDRIAAPITIILAAFICTSVTLCNLQVKNGA